MLFSIFFIPRRFGVFFVFAEASSLGFWFLFVVVFFWGLFLISCLRSFRVWVLVFARVLSLKEAVKVCGY